MFSRFFINRPIFATVISLIIIIAGAMSIASLPVKQYPAVVPPQIMVRVVYPGADASTLSKTVATTIEQAINGVKNMTYMTSTSSPSGILTISVFFKIGSDVDQAKVDVNNRVQLIINKLPQEVQKQGVTVKERSPDILKVVAFMSKDRVHDPVFISNYLKINVIDDLKRIKGVGEVIIFGEKDYSVRVWIDPSKLSFYKLTSVDIVNAIRVQNNQYAAGSIGAEPIQNIQPFTYNIITSGRFHSIKEFQDIIIRSNPDGSSLRLSDVAKVEIGSNALTTVSQYKREPMVSFGVFLSPGANALEVANQVNDTLEELSVKFPKDIYYKSPYDATVFVKASIEEVVQTLFEAILFVVILMYLFLGNLRATIIPVLAIPVSIIGTFAGFYVAGFSINLLTLFGLILAIGLVVDDAIIVIENVERILRTKKDITVKDATIEAMRELVTPIVAIVLVLCAVFIPAALTSGFSGVMYKQFAMTIVISVVISGIVALTLTPALCAMFLRKDEPEALWPIRKFNQYFDWSTKVFIIFTRQTIRLWFFSLLLFGGLLYLTYDISQKLPTGLVPSEDKGTLMVLAYMMPSTSLANSASIVDGIEKTLLENPNVVKTGAITGIDLITFAFKSDAAIIFTGLKPWSEREAPNQSSQALAGQLMGQFMQNKDAFVIPVNPPPIIGMSATGGFDLWVQDRTGGSLHTLSKYIKEIVAEANKDPRLTRVRTTLSTNSPQYKITVDKEKAEAMGVSIGSIFATLKSTYGQGYVNDFNLYSRTFHVNVQSQSQYRATKKSFTNTFVRSQSGNLVPISELVSMKRVVDASVIQRFNMFNSAKITGNPSMGFASSDATTAIEEIATKILPQGYTLAWAGTSYQEKKLEKEGNFTAIYASLFVFLILAALYESWSIPIAVILSIPFAIFGATLAVYLRGLEADIYFQVGIITLIGLSAKNAILIVEFAMDKLKNGATLMDATLEAARLRFRPIVMTSLAFIVGTLPLAISSGAGSASRHIIGTTVVGGMISATVIGVLFIPMFFYIVMWIKLKFTTKKS